MKRTLVMALAALLCRAGGWAQETEIASKLGYPQVIVYNGKIVTMDDDSFESRVGTIVPAMAIRDGKILATGNNAAVRALAGPQTKAIDLQGRTVLPSFISTHEHPTDWSFQEPRAITHVLPSDDVIVQRWLPSVPAKEQMALFEPTMREALAKAKPGQWILLSFNWGPAYEWGEDMAPLFAKSITKAYLDQLAPNNPVKVKGGFINSVVNQRALDELRTVHPKLDVISEQELKTGYGFTRPMEPDAMLKGKTEILAQILQAEMAVWASYGVTTFGSSPYTAHNYQALNYLDQKGEMPGRFAWGYIGPDFTPEMLRYLAGSLGHGTDHIWLTGAWDAAGANCSSVPARPEAIARRQGTPNLAGRCSFAPGSAGRETLTQIIRSGMRVATMHSGQDKDIDYFMDVIEQASQEAGMSLEQIRALRHSFDHSGGAPRPDQIPRMKKLGMMASLNNHLLASQDGHWGQRSTGMMAELYGVEYAGWVSPRKSLTNAGVMSSWEIDRPLPHLLFFYITKGMNRYNDKDKQVYGPNERTDRIIQLKALTRWGAYYVLRENLLGSLEPGKFADFIVLDRDFLTISEAEIPDTTVLMTVVGGKPVHLVSSLAREIGMEPVGPTTWREAVPAGWK